MPKKYRVLIGLIVFLITLLATAPARLVGIGLADSAIVASGYSGSIWRGQASSVAVPVAGQYLQLGGLEWRLSPWCLLLLSPSLEFDASWGRQQISGAATYSAWGGWAIKRATATFEASLAQLIAPVQLFGSMQLMIEELSFDEGSFAAGNGRLVWRRAAWRGNRSQQVLGDYVLEFEVLENSELRGQVSSLSGPVLVNGSASLVEKTYSIDLLLGSEEPLSTELRSALELIASPTADGFHLKFSASL